MGIVENWMYIRERVNLACQYSGRSPDDVKILVASKYMREGIIKEIFSLGLKIFGENQIQSAQRKMENLSDLPIKWHFIGHLQSNKINRFLSLDFELFHSLDRVNLIYTLNERAERKGKKVKVLLEANLYKEKTKYGFTEEKDLWSAFELINKKMKFIECVGLMTMTPFGANERILRNIFSKVRTLADEMRLTEISMGTSSDFEIAIQEGATIVRIGSAFLNFV